MTSEIKCKAYQDDEGNWREPIMGWAEATIAKINWDQYGFLTKEDIDMLAHYHAHRLLLIRCGCGRMLVPAYCTRHYMECINKSGTDWVRDVSLPATVSHQTCWQKKERTKC